MRTATLLVFAFSFFGPYSANASSSLMDKDLFNKIVDAVEDFFTPLAAQSRERLQIIRGWEDSTINSPFPRGSGVVTYKAFGGLARRSEITPDGFALIMCHDLGQYYAGQPYLNIPSKISAEGQADYYATQACLGAVLERYTYDFSLLEHSDYVARSCESISTAKGITVESCKRAMTAQQSVGNLLAVLKKEPLPSFATPDQTVVAKTVTAFPKTVQCRLDTYRAGYLGLPRPACWFKEPELAGW